MEYEHIDMKNSSYNVNTCDLEDLTPSSAEVCFHDENVVVKTEPEVANSSSDTEPEDLDEIYRNANLANNSIDIVDASTMNDGKDVDRMSTKLRTKGAQPVYAFFNNGRENSESDSHIKEVLNPPIKPEIENNYCEGGEGILKIKVKKNLIVSKTNKTRKIKAPKKRQQKNSDLECVKPIKESDNSNKSNITDKSNEVKKKRVRNRTIKFQSEVDKSYKNSKKKKNEPWISIRLEDYPEKYHMECVGSFERKNRGSNIVDELYSCLQCGRFKSSGKQIFEEHIEKHVNGVLECPQCNYSGRSEVEVANHKTEHGHLGEERKYVCDICGIVLCSYDSRLSHIGRVHNDPKYKCQYCELMFATRLRRLQHIRSDHPEIAQHCLICKRDFRTSTAELFKEHISTCEPGFTCQVCGHAFTSRSGLTNHIKLTHMNIRKYQCHMCQYAGKSGRRLREHIMTHTGSHPYSCDQCTFTCVQAYQLTSHQRTHTGDKPYKCKQCNFAAAWNVQLKDHIKVHSMNTAVNCESCNILFKNEKSRKMHEKKDHQST